MSDPEAMVQVAEAAVHIALVICAAVVLYRAVPLLLR